LCYKIPVVAGETYTISAIIGSSNPNNSIDIYAFANLNDSVQVGQADMGGFLSTVGQSKILSYTFSVK
jgi:hypothetical protein